MENLNNQGLPQWQIKYDSMHNLSSNQSSSNGNNEKSSGKLALSVLFLSIILLVGLYYKSQLIKEDQNHT